MSLNVKVYINILLIIVIIGIIVSNMGVNIVIGRRDNPFTRDQSDYPVGTFMENFDGDENNDDNGEENSDVNGDKRESSSEDLKKYADKLAGMADDITKTVMDRVDDKVKNGNGNVEPNVEKFGNAPFPQMQVKPDNYFSVGPEANVANFGSNVMDINKFYSNSFGDIEFKTPYNGGAQAGSGQISAKQQLGGFNSVDKKTGNGVGTYKPDMWQYKEELVMNGGNLFGEVSGFDGMNDGLATFDGSAVVGMQCAGDNMNNCKLGNDDLRMGMGILGRNQRMSE